MYLKNYCSYAFNSCVNGDADVAYVASVFGSTQRVGIVVGGVALHGVAARGAID